ncbi:MAG: hypothetical protein JO010_05465 [Alphaproteobacteria bacterium]|nr:hypothetical protein [Alphaproteobacteria bacterium]
MEAQKLDCLEATGERAVDIGDLDLKRNLKLRSFLGLALAPVFRELQPRLRYDEMGRRGITPAQYFQDFRNNPAPFGYGDRFHGRYTIRLFRSISDERRGGRGETQRVERIILETRTILTASPAVATPAALGFEPPLGAPAIAGDARVLHVLTRPGSPPGRRWVTDIPEELGFLAPHPFDEPFPTIALLGQLDDGFTAAGGSHFHLAGIWGVANSDVFQHIHAREYTMAMENGVTQCLAAAGIALESYAATRARVIFRRPSFIGQPYRLRVRLFRRGAELVALGAFEGAEEGFGGDDGRAAVYLRFEGRLS